MQQTFLVNDCPSVWRIHQITSTTVFVVATAFKFIVDSKLRRVAPSIK